MKKCSFCGREYEEEQLVEGKQGYICAGCLYVGLEVIEGDLSEPLNRESKTTFKHSPSVDLLKPSELKARLDEFVIGQEEAKRLVTAEVYAHLKQNLSNDTVFKKHNMCLIGPSGSGKTYLIECLAKQLQIPFVVEDATSLSKTGYVGNSVSTMLERLYYAAKGDLQLAQRGIIFLDEVDKLSSCFKSGVSKGDVGTTGIQQELLKILEGSEVELTIHEGRSSYNVTFDTRHVLFIVGGAFVGLDEQKKKKQKSQNIGFGVCTTDSDNILLSPERTSHQDLIDYGLTPELVGRLSLLVDLKPLTEDEIRRVMTESKGSVVKSYIERFKREGVSLEFADETIAYLAKVVTQSKLGVRGIEGHLSLVLNQLFYQVLENDAASKEEQVLVIKPEHLHLLD